MINLFICHVAVISIFSNQLPPVSWSNLKRYSQKIKKWNYLRSTVSKFFALVLFILILLMRLRHVESLVNWLWNCFNFSSKFLLNLIQIEAIFKSNQVYCKTKMAKTARSTNAMQVCFWILWKIKVNDNIDGLYINTTGEQIWKITMQITQ